MRIKEVLNKLPNYMEVDVVGLTEDQLNDIAENDWQDWDSSLDFRSKVVNEGYRIVKLMAKYYQGWECDEWSCFATKGGHRYYIGTSHGDLEVEE